MKYFLIKIILCIDANHTKTYNEMSNKSEEIKMAGLKNYQVTDHQDNTIEITASQLVFDDSWVKFYVEGEIIAAFFQPAGFELVEELE